MIFILSFFFCSLSLLSGEIRRRENMHFTFYLKTSKSSICHTSSKTGIRQDYYIRPPPVSTSTVKYRVYYPVQCMVDPGECLQGMVPSSPFLWWKIKCTKAHLICPKWRKRGPAMDHSRSPILGKKRCIISLNVSVFCTLLGLPLQYSMLVQKHFLFSW